MDDLEKIDIWPDIKDCNGVIDDKLHFPFSILSLKGLKPKFQYGEKRLCKIYKYNNLTMLVVLIYIMLFSHYMKKVLLKMWFIFLTAVGVVLYYGFPYCRS
jgi:hypothetical protein